MSASLSDSFWHPQLSKRTPFCNAPSDPVFQRPAVALLLIQFFGPTCPVRCDGGCVNGVVQRLEPKDGSAQRMMIVDMTQVSTTEFSPSTLAQPHHVDRRGIGAQTPRTTIMAYLRGASEDQTQTTELPGLYTGHGLQIQSGATATITTLLVVCMQRDREIPIRGARYFSQPKPAEGPVQTCQRNCVLNYREFIQQCVWQCENDESTVR